MSINTRNVQPQRFTAFKDGFYLVDVHEVKVSQANSGTWGVNVELRIEGRQTRVWLDTMWVTQDAYPFTLGRILDLTGQEFTTTSTSEARIAEQIAAFIRANHRPFSALCQLQSWKNEMNGQSGKKVVLRNAAE